MLLLEDVQKTGVEEKVTLHEILGVDPGGANGKVDFYALTDTRLLVADYKYGEGVAVDAVGNMQLKLYALGLCKALGHEGDLTLMIYQPRIMSTPSVWQTTTDVLNRELSILRTRAQEAWKSDAKTRRVTGDHCRWCPAKALCSCGVETTKDRLKEAYAKHVEAAKSPQASVDELCAALDDLGEVTRFVEELRDRVKTALGEGYKANNWELIIRTNKSWKADKQTVLRTLMAAGVAEMDVLNLITPAACGKLVSKAAWLGSLEPLTSTSVTTALQRKKSNGEEQ
jgi:hypothetical protein